MSNLTEGQRIERARQARMALTEFLDPAFVITEQDYAEKMIEAAASSDPRAREVIERLANGIKACRTVRSLIAALVADGAEAQNNIERARRIEEMNPSQRRLLKVAPR